jgi:hypothetical protein
MERVDVAYLINTTPKYFYLLPLHLLLLRRYAPSCQWPVFLATEEPHHPDLLPLEEKYNIQILPLAQDESGFLESRKAAIQKLPPYIEYVFPVQEDFLLERYPDTKAINDSLALFDKSKDLASIRWMPCPGPETPVQSILNFAEIQKTDTYKYVFQATMWRRSVIEEWFTKLVEDFNQEYPQTLPMKERMYYQIRVNYAENQKGQEKFWTWFGHLKHLAWIRAHKAPNAVYMSPWPYRPTAVTNGKLEAWAVEMAKREGYNLKETDNKS